MSFYCKNQYSFIDLSMQFNATPPRGKGFWKMNSKLLELPKQFD